MSLPRFICASDLDDDLLCELADVGSVEIDGGGVYRRWRSDPDGTPWLVRVGVLRAMADYDYGDDGDDDDGDGVDE